MTGTATASVGLIILAFVAESAFGSLAGWTVIGTGFCIWGLLTRLYR